jgi:hypothetical protein
MLRFNWDILLFRSGLSFLPILSVGLSTAAPFFSVYYLGWSWLCFLVIPLVLFGCEKFNMPTLTTSKTGLAWGLIFTAEYSYYINAAQEYDKLINSIVAVIGVAICYTLYKASNTKAYSLIPDQDR